MSRLAVLSDEELLGAPETIRPPRQPKPSLVRRVEANRITGSIRKLKQDRGFGFIAGDDGRDHFFHWSGLDKSTKDFKDLEIKDRVSFICIEGDKGPRAVVIQVISEKD